MFSDILNFLFNGTLNGAILSLIALGYSLTYGVGHIMDLANGAYVMTTGYLLLWFLKLMPGLEIVSVIIAVITVTIIGGLSYLLLIKPMQETPVGAVLITFALAFFIEQFILIIYGTESYSITNYIVIGGFSEVFEFRMINQFIFLIIVSLIIVSLFALFINKSKLGKSIRAVSQDREAASLMGINSNRTLLYTLMISAFLAS